MPSQYGLSARRNVIAKRKGGRPKGLAKTGGRTKGTKNKIQSDIKLLAQDHGPAAIGVPKADLVSVALAVPTLDRAAL
jgi:hypothetical protein